MGSNYISAIIEIIDTKIELLQNYKAITDKMVNSDLDTIAKLIAERQLIIPQVDEKSAEIRKIIARQPQNIQTVLRSILSFKNAECESAFLSLKSRAEVLEKTLIDISYKEKDVVIRMEILKKELAEDMLKSNKSKQVIDYCSSFAFNNFNGSSFNSLT